MDRDSGSRPTGRDVKQARGEARQSGAESASPNTFVSSPSMTIKEMTDRVARAIFDSHNATYTMGGPARWESDPEHWRRYAQAAIDAIGSPEAVTEEMIRAGRMAAMAHRLGGPKDETLTAIYEAMREAALLKVALQL